MRRKQINHQPTFFTAEEHMEKLLSMRNELDQLDKMIPWENFRSLLVRVREDNSVKGGRPPYDEILMFKCLILQSLYNLSDEEVEFRILDSRSFTKFLGISIYIDVPDHTDVPDHNTIRQFRELLKEHQLLHPLFDLFERYVSQKGIKVRKGLMKGTTLVEVPKPHDTREENV